MAPMFNDCMVKSSITIAEYQELNNKMRNIAQVAQKLFTLSLLNDKLEKEKSADIIKSRLSQDNTKELSEK